VGGGVSYHMGLESKGMSDCFGNIAFDFVLCGRHGLGPSDIGGISEIRGPLLLGRLCR
jgi:hypothetical protein